MTKPTRLRRRPFATGRHTRPPVVDTDLHAYVLARLDAHLEALHLIRAELARPRATRPGGRWAAAVASLVAARRYARDLAVALGTCGEPPPATGTASPGGHVIDVRRSLPADGQEA